MMEAGESHSLGQVSADHTGDTGQWPGGDQVPALVLPLLERSCSDCGVGGGPGQYTQKHFRLRRQGKFRRVLSETW